MYLKRTLSYINGLPPDEHEKDLVATENDKGVYSLNLSININFYEEQVDGHSHYFSSVKFFKTKNDKGTFYDYYSKY